MGSELPDIDSETLDLSTKDLDLALSWVKGKLKVRGEERDLIHTRQGSLDKIDERLISELGFDNGNVFSHKFTERYNTANLRIFQLMVVVL